MTDFDDDHKATWRSPDLNTKNQIDHVVIDVRHASSNLDVRTLRSANMDSDHILIAAKVRTRLCAYNNTCKLVQRRFDVQKLRSQKIVESPFAFRNSFTMLLQIPTSIRSGNTLPNPCTLLLGKSLDTVDSRSQLGPTMNIARQELRRTTHIRPH